MPYNQDFVCNKQNKQPNTVKIVEKCNKNNITKIFSCLYIQENVCFKLLNNRIYLKFYVKVEKYF